MIIWGPQLTLEDTRATGFLKSELNIQHVKFEVPVTYFGRVVQEILNGRPHLDRQIRK